MITRTLRPMSVGRITVCCLLLAASTAAWSQERAGRRAPKPPTPRPSPPPAAVARAEAPEQSDEPKPIPVVCLEATVFRVRVAADRIVELDAQALAKAAPTPADMAKVLEGYGAVEVAYRVDQQVAADGGRPSDIEVVRDQPYVSGVTTTDSGEVRRSVSRHRVGINVSFSGAFLDAQKRDLLQVTLRVEISDLMPGEVEIQQGVRSLTLWRIKQEHCGTVKLGQPVVLLNAAGPTALGGESLAIVSLVEFTAVEPSPQ